MRSVCVAAASEVAPNTVIEVFVAQQPFAVCNVAGEYHALGGICPHRGAPLGQGTVNGRFLTCPWHMWDFDCFTGENDFDPRQKVEHYSVKMENGKLFLELP